MFNQCANWLFCLLYSLICLFWRFLLNLMLNALLTQFYILFGIVYFYLIVFFSSSFICNLFNVKIINSTSIYMWLDLYRASIYFCLVLYVYALYSVLLLFIDFFFFALFPYRFHLWRTNSSSMASTVQCLLFCIIHFFIPFNLCTDLIWWLWSYLYSFI